MTKPNRDFLLAMPNLSSEMAEEFGYTKEQVEDMLDQHFASVKRYLTDWRMPKVYLPIIGTLSPTPGALRRSIHNHIRNYRNGYISREKLQGHLDRLWPVYKRIQAETAKYVPGVGNLTYWPWSRKYMRTFEAYQKFKHDNPTKKPLDYTPRKFGPKQGRGTGDTL
jgi:hypothetical protein